MSTHRHQSSTKTFHGHMPPKGNNKNNANQNRVAQKKAARKTVTVRRSNAPLAQATVTTNRRQPVQRILPNGNMRMRHKELLGGVYGDDGLAIVINPGNSALCTWLARTAPQYESYIMHALHVTYKPSVPKTYAGELFMNVDYDASDPAPVDLKARSATPGSVSGNIGEGFKFVSRPADLRKRKEYYVHSPGMTQSSTEGQRSTNVGVFYAYVDGAYNAAGDAFTGLCGYLWVEYDVEFRTPQLTTGNSASAFAAYETVLPAATAPTTVTVARKGSAALSNLETNLFPTKWNATDSAVTPYAQPILTQAFKGLINAYMEAKPSTGASKIASINQWVQPYKTDGTDDYKGHVKTVGNFWSQASATANGTSQASFLVDLPVKEAIQWGLGITSQGSTGSYGVTQETEFIPLPPRAYDWISKSIGTVMAAAQSLYVLGAGTFSAANSFGDAAVVSGRNGGTAKGEFEWTTVGASLKLPAGTWHISGHWVGTSLVVGASFGVHTGFDLASTIIVTNGTSSAVGYRTIVVVGDGDQTIDFSMTSGTISGSNLYVSAVPARAIAEPTA